MELIGCFLILLGFLFSVFGSVFWIWMLIDCVTKERSDGNSQQLLIWVLIIVLLNFLGAILYFFVRRP